MSDELRAGSKQGTGVLYVLWPGDSDVEEQLERSMASVREHHPELPIHVERLPEGSTLLDKARMAEFTPFWNTLYLDVDTVLLDRLDYGFDKSRQYGLACAICECPYARRFDGLKDDGDIVEYNTGVLFFAQFAERVFQRWNKFATTLPSAHRFMKGPTRYEMPLNDQASFAKAIEYESWNPFVLPVNWNYRPFWHRGIFGPVKVWHDRRPVSSDIRGWNEQHAAPESVMQFALVD